MGQESSLILPGWLTLERPDSPPHAPWNYSHAPQWPQAFACTIERIARLTSHPAAVAMDSYAVAITCVFHGAPVHRSSFPLLVLVLPFIHPPTQDFSRGAFSHISARRCAHGLCANQADPSLMRRVRLNRHLNRSSPVRLQRMRVCARASRCNGESRGESDLYSDSCLPHSLSLSRAENSGNSEL